jgi:type I restriction enzyme S subunit
MVFTNSLSSYYEKFLATGEVKCIDEEIPFEIPATWEWCRLGYIFSHCTGKALNGTNRKGNLYTYITTSNLYWDRFELSSLKEMYFTEEELGKCTATKGDLLVCEGGDIGRSAIWNYDYNIRIQNHIHKLRSYIPLCTRFFYYVMYLYKGIGYIGGKGIGIQGLSSGALHNILIPTPSINEQKRIISQIEAIMPIAVKYEKSQEELNQLNDSIHNRLRKSILQEAIQGKLVPQIPEERTAQELLEQIRQEKQKLVKEGKLKKFALSDSVIYKGDDNKYFEKNGKTEQDITDEIPFEIPNNWEWCRIGSVLNIWSARRVHEKDWRTSGIPFYRAREISKMADCGHVDNDLFIEQSLYDEFSKSGVPQIGDLMMTAVGTLGKTYVVETKNPFYYKDGSVLCIGNPFRLNPYYLKLFFESFAFTNQYLSESDGTTVATLTMVRLNRYLIPIPPLMEQTRIVEKIKAVTSIMRG